MLIINFLKQDKYKNLNDIFRCILQISVVHLLNINVVQTKLLLNQLKCVFY